VGRVVALLTASAIVACCGLVLWMSWGAIGEPKPAEAQSRERSCPGPSRQILNESGGDASTSSQGFANYGPFTTTGDSFVVTMDASSSQPARPWPSVKSVLLPALRLSDDRPSGFRGLHRY
jgi:hypothetical protein